MLCYFLARSRISLLMPCFSAGKVSGSCQSRQPLSITGPTNPYLKESEQLNYLMPGLPSHRLQYLKLSSCKIHYISIGNQAVNTVTNKFCLNNIIVMITLHSSHSLSTPLVMRLNEPTRPTRYPLLYIPQNSDCNQFWRKVSEKLSIDKDHVKIAQLRNISLWWAAKTYIFNFCTQTLKGFHIFFSVANG